METAIHIGSHHKCILETAHHATGYTNGNCRSSGEKQAKRLVESGDLEPFARLAQTTRR